MAVRQQQRRGTATQWSSANPILSAGEIGFEIDTNKFKIGDGTTRWASLTYFTADAAAAIQDLIDGAPGILDTLNELAAAVGDDANFFSTVTTNIATAKSEAIATASSDATTKANAAKSGAEATAATALTAHEADTTNIHGIADTAALATKTYADSAVSTAVSALTKSSVGLGNVDNPSDVNKPVSIATQAELDLKAPLANPNFTGTVSGITRSMIGLANVDNTSDTDKPISTATQAALDTKAPLVSPELTGNPTAPTQELGNDSTRIATTAFVKAAIQDISSLNLILDGGGVA